MDTEKDLMNVMYQTGYDDGQKLYWMILLT